jgi:hypothetical protein
VRKLARVGHTSCPLFIKKNVHVQDVTNYHVYMLLREGYHAAR